MHTEARSSERETYAGMQLSLLQEVVGPIARWGEVMPLRISESRALEAAEVTIVL